MAANTPASFACFGVLNDANIELFHSAVNLSANVINSIGEQDGLPNTNILFRSELPYRPLVANFSSTVVDGNLTCRSRTSGREQSVYIGGKYIHTYMANSISIPICTLYIPSSICQYVWLFIYFPDFYKSCTN